MYKLITTPEYYYPPVHHLVQRTNMMVELVKELTEGILVIVDSQTEQVVYMVEDTVHPGQLRRELMEFLRQNEGMSG